MMMMMMMIERSQPDVATRCLCSGEEGPACLLQEGLCYLSLFLHFLLFIIVKFSVWKAFLRHLRKYRISNIYSPNKERFWVATLDRNDTRLRNIIGFPLPIGLWSLEDKKTKYIQNPECHIFHTSAPFLWFFGSGCASVSSCLWHLFGSVHLWLMVRVKVGVRFSGRINMLSPLKSTVLSPASGCQLTTTVPPVGLVWPLPYTERWGNI